MAAPIRYGPSAPTFSRISEARLPELRQSVRAMLDEGSSHKAAVFNHAYWDWQYQELPSRRSLVYVALLDDQIIGYYHVPLYKVRVKGQDRLAGVVQDVAVSAKARGQGVFRRLAEFAHEDMPREGVDFTYTFPNQKSIRTFLEYNAYTAVGELPAYVMPLRAGRIVSKALGLGNALPMKAPAGGEIKAHVDFDGRLERLFQSFLKDKDVALCRDGAFLRWRFIERPRSEHFVFSLNGPNGPTAAAVFKRDAFRGLAALILMDFAFLPGMDSHLGQLILELRERGRDFLPYSPDLIFAAGLSPGLDALLRTGFLRVPSLVNPRRLHLLCRNLSSDEALVPFDPNRWHVTLADWDVL